ncbi:MAG TPA: ATP-binding protein [Spirochaetia bacterium]|nr:ATP-binding protein [Spirochaetia bacterium]
MTPKRSARKKTLRKRAERILTEKTRPPHRTSYEKIAQELEVHQIELELQVEELRRAETDLQQMQNRYLSLYDDAPVGYLTLDRFNLVAQVNRAAEEILGAPRTALKRRKFSLFLEESSRATFVSLSADARRSSLKYSFDAKLAPQNGLERWVKLDCTAGPETGELRVTLVDITERRTAEKELRQLAEGLIQLQEKERRTIAEALHDDAGQQLTYLAIILDQARESKAGLDYQKADQLSEVAREILQRIRTLSASLSPAELTRVGLVGAVKSMISEFTTRTSIPVSFTATGSLQSLGFELSLAVYRIVQEALTNAARHAQPTGITVAIQSTAGRLKAEIRDDGKGFNARSSHVSLGLLSMRERARAVGGKLGIESSPGTGTRVTFERSRDGGTSRKHRPHS